MISHVRGEVIEKGINDVIVDVSGIGYRVYCPGPEIDRISQGENVMLYTHFSVRENAQDLYGFIERETRSLFELLLGVSGVGPKVALSIVGLGPASDVRSAIANQDIAYISSASGVGKRGAEKIAVELKDKVGLASVSGYGVAASGGSDDALDGLLALGYNQAQASVVLSKIDATLSAEDRIRAALKELSA